MEKAVNKQLYQEVKDYIYAKIPKHSAYRSGHVIKEYKRRGGKFRDDGKERKLSRWFNEKWKDVNPNTTRGSYPVYRPTVRINKRTPLTLREIDREDLIKQSRRKQVIKGSRNLRPFKRKSSKKSVRKSPVRKPIKKSVRKSPVRKSPARKPIKKSSRKSLVRKPLYNRKSRKSRINK
jgi:hypothetical protein